MIGYVTLGTKDIEKAAKFYDELLATIGGSRVMEMGTFIAWGNSPTGCWLAITKPYDGKPATVGNGTMAGIAVDSSEKVHAVYDKAISLGGTDEGAPGPRSDNFYAGYFRDPDGNKLNVFYASQPG